VRARFPREIGRAIASVVHPTIVALTRGPQARRVQRLVSQLPSNFVVYPSHATTTSARDSKISLHLEPPRTGALVTIGGLGSSKRKDTSQFGDSSRPQEEDGTAMNDRTDVAQAIERTILEKTTVQREKRVSTNVRHEHDGIEGGLMMRLNSPGRSIATKRIPQVRVQFHRGHVPSLANDLPFSGERRTDATSVARPRGGAGAARAVAASASVRAARASVRPLQRLVMRRPAAHPAAFSDHRLPRALESPK